MRLAATAVWIGMLLTAGGCTQATPAAAPKPPAPRAVPRPAPPRPPAVISPQSSPEEERRLTQLTYANIESAEQRLKQLGERRLSAVDTDTAQTIRSFITKAREALGASDPARAATLADKARVLAEELARNLR